MPNSQRTHVLLIIRADPAPVKFVAQLPVADDLRHDYYTQLSLLVAWFERNYPSARRVQGSTATLDDGPVFQVDVYESPDNTNEDDLGPLLPTTYLATLVSATIQ